jgi:Flp pilus assembly protein TadG
MRKSFLNFKDRNEGVAAVEFALIAPIFLFLLIGAFDYGIYINKQMLLESTARAAAEYVNQGGTTDTIDDNIVDLVQFNVNADSMASLIIDSSFVCECTGGDTVNCDDGCTDDPSDTYMRRFINIDISMDFETVFPYPGIPDTITLRGNSRLQVE